jgi:DNA-binding MarR family transcriptional regulator
MELFYWSRGTLEMTEAVSIADRLHSTAIHLLRRVRRVDEATGLTAAKLSALSVIVFGGPISLRDLAAAEQVRPPSMTRTVKELEADELVRREVDGTDRRIVRIRPTAKGERIMKEGRAARINLLAQWLSALSRDELARVDQATRILERLLAGSRERRKH